MTTKKWALLLVLFTTLLTSTAQILWKRGSANLTLSLLGIFTNYNIIIGTILYVVGAIILLLSLRGGEVSVLYPIFASSYIWVSLFSVKFLGETINIYKWIGITLIVIGTFFVVNENKYFSSK